MDGFTALEGILLGRDPGRSAQQVAAIETINFHAGRYWPLEAALWDIVRQAAELPVSVLFGGARQRLPAYASFGQAPGPAQPADAPAPAGAARFPRVTVRSTPDAVPRSHP